MGSLGKEVVEDCFGLVQLYSDGSVYRATQSPIQFLNNNNINKNEEIIEWEDCLFDEKNKLYLRVYKPTKITTPKLPVVYYFHGGGFCLGSRAWPNCHNCCLHLSSQLQSIVIAPDYRLAPEHRLPAAIEDGMSAMKWLQLQALKSRQQQNKYSPNNNNNNNNIGWSHLVDDKRVDFDQVFVVGDSSGGNIAHHLAVLLGSGSGYRSRFNSGSRSTQLDPIRVRGYVLLAPFFGGSLRTKSEVAPLAEPTLNLDTLDRFWRLSLRVGENRDSPLANPFGPSSPNLEKIGLGPMLVIVGSNEIMKDRIEDYAKRLRGIGKDLTYIEIEGQHHGFLTHNPFSHASNQFLQLLKRFMLPRD